LKSEATTEIGFDDHPPRQDAKPNGSMQLELFLAEYLHVYRLEGIVDVKALLNA